MKLSRLVYSWFCDLSVLLAGHLPASSQPINMLEPTILTTDLIELE